MKLISVKKCCACDIELNEPDMITRIYKDEDEKDNFFIYCSVFCMKEHCRLEKLGCIYCCGNSDCCSNGCLCDNCCDQDSDEYYLKNN